MKIVDVCAFYAPKGGGVRTYVERKLEAAPRLGHEISVIVPGDGYRIEPRGHGARIIHLPAPRLPFDRNYRYFDDEDALLAVLDAERPDFVEVSSPWRSAETVARWRGTAPRALVMHADPLSAYAYRWFGPVASRESIDRGFSWYWRKLRRLDRSYDLVVAASRDLSRRLTDGGLDRVETIPMGIGPGVFTPSKRDEDLRADLLSRCNLGPSATLLLGIGRLAPEKRWPMIVDACASAGLSRPLGLVLVGGGRERERLLRHIGDNPHVRLLEPIADRDLLARVLASGDALVHGCEAETFGLAGAEARASGLPVVAPDRGGAADHAGLCGELFESGNSTDAAAAILRLIARLPRARADAIAAAGNVHTMDQHFEALFARYAEILDAQWRQAA